MNKPLIIKLCDIINTPIAFKFYKYFIITTIALGIFYILKQKDKKESIIITVGCLNLLFSFFFAIKTIGYLYYLHKVAFSPEKVSLLKKEKPENLIVYCWGKTIPHWKLEEVEVKEFNPMSEKVETSSTLAIINTDTGEKYLISACKVIRKHQ